MEISNLSSTSLRPMAISSSEKFFNSSSKKSVITLGKDGFVETNNDEREPRCFHSQMAYEIANIRSQRQTVIVEDYQTLSLILLRARTYSLCISRSDLGQFLRFSTDGSQCQPKKR